MNKKQYVHFYLFAQIMFFLLSNSANINKQVIVVCICILFMYLTETVHI